MRGFLIKNLHCEMARVVLKNIPPGFSDSQILQEFVQVSDLIEDVAISHKKSFLSYKPAHPARRIPSCRTSESF